ncbi:MaoC family dehydratase [Bordetella bronchiseptica]|uniref:MaoC family dehydratase n=1 Tax=Bordetella bronchiseptica TaxID=518 RepID=UPI0013F606EA|nr:MaoC family dehydratase [Bordetella bronchiseptica]
MQRTLDITQAMIDGYGRVNGDNDIIHYDHDYAVQRGFRGTLLHGPHMTALAADLGARRYASDWLYRGKLHTKWIGPVCPGDTFVATLNEQGEIEAVSGGKTVMVGSASLAD